MIADGQECPSYFSRGSEFGGGMRRYLRLFIAVVVFLATRTETLGQDKEKGKPPPLKTTSATPAETLKVLKGFRAELLYSVPKEKQGSWVNMCVDPKGRLIVSDQYGPLYRITPPALGGSAADTKVERLPLQLGGAHGLLWAFDSLYVVVNKGQRYESGLYRIKAGKDGDQLEEVKLLRK